MTRLLISAALTLAVAGCSSGNMIGTNQDAGSRDRLVKNLKIQDEYRGTNLSSVDQPFVRDSLRLTAFEIKASKLAIEKSQHPEVKRIASRLLKDDEATRQKLLKIVQQRGENLPSDVTFDQQQILDELHGLSGTEFDMAYLQHMQKSHQYLLTTAQSLLEYGKNTDVKALTRQSLDKWQQELQMVAGERPLDGSRITSERD